MSLPSSGQISFSNVATEMEQTGFTAAQYNYWIGSWSKGEATYPYAEGFQFAPINVHSDNTGKYAGDFPLRMSQWYGYNRSANYAPGTSFRDLFFSISPAMTCYPSSFIEFDAGTTNKTYDLTISGSAADFTYVNYVVAFYGKPWQSNSLGLGNSSVLYSNFVNGSALNTTQTINYTYDSAKGQYIYVVIYGNCP